MPKTLGPRYEFQVTGAPRAVMLDLRARMLRAAAHLIHNGLHRPTPATAAERAHVRRQVADYRARRRDRVRLFIGVAILAGVVAALAFGCAETLSRIGGVT